MHSKALSRIAASLAIAEVLVVIVSWLLSATMTEGVHSLLSPEGVRWFFSNFTSILLTPLLSWLLLAAMAWGVLRASGIVATPATSSSRRRLSLRISILVLVTYLSLIVLLVAVPHAMLLSATGQLWPSPFSASIVPLLAFGVVLVSAAYGLSARTLRSFSDICQALICGLAAAAPLLFIYILAAQLFESFLYVFY